MDQEEEIVEILQGIRTITYRSLKELLDLAKEASCEGDFDECVNLGRCALHQVDMSNNVIKTFLINKHRPEWAVLEDAEAYIEEQKIASIFGELASNSIGVMTMKSQNIQA